MMILKKDLQQLKNENLAKIGVFNHTLWLCFGDEITTLNEFGIPTTTYPFTLHTNCSWRFTTGKEIVFAKQDMFAKNDILNTRISAINGKLQSGIVLVKSVEINEFSDVKIMLSDEIRIDFFSDTSIPNEQLKFISQRNVGSSQNEDVQVVALQNEIVEESAFEMQVGNDNDDIADDEQKMGTGSEEIKENRLVTELFEDNRFKKFSEFCRMNNLFYENDITPQVLWVFGQTKGVGQATIPKIERLLDIKMEIPSSFEQSEYLENFKIQDTTAPKREEVLDLIDIGDVDYNNFEDEPLAENFGEVVETAKEKTDLLLSKIFESSAYGLFREFCINENLRFTNDITDEHLLKFKRSQGVGKKRYLDIVNRLQELDYTEIPADFKIGDIHNYKGILIPQVFGDGAYRLFYEFCKRQNLTYINDITDNHLWEFRRTQGVGQKRYLDILNRLEAFATELKKAESSNFEVGEIYEYVKGLKISDAIVQLKIEGINFSDAKLSELEGKNLTELKHISEARYLVELSSKLSRLQNPKNSLLEFKNQLKNNQQTVLKLRIHEEKTLEEVGQELDVTRERARQIESKLREKINSFFYTNRLNDSLVLILDNKSYVTSTDLTEIFGQEHIDIINLLKLSEAPLYYNPEFDIFFFKELNKIEFQERIDSFLDELPEIFKLSEYEHLLNEILPSSDNFNFELVYDKYGFNKYGDFYSARKLHAVDILNLLYKHYIIEPIKLDEVGTQRIVELAEEHFEFQLTNEMRAIDARARDSEQLLLVDKLTYQWFDPTTIDAKLLIDMFGYLKNEFETREFVTAEQVYSEFKERLNEQQIFNKLHMYSLIKYFFSDQLTIGKGNTLNIYPDENNRMSIEEKMIALIEKDGGYSTKTKIQKTTHWTMFRIDQIISESKQIVALEKDNIRLFKTIDKTNEIKNELLKLISKCMHQGFTTTAIILEEITKVPHLNNFINVNKLSNSKALASFIKIIQPEIKGHTLFLHYDSNPEKTFEEALACIICGKIKRQSLLNKIQEYGYSEAMATVIVSNITEKRLFVEIDRGIYLPSSKLNIQVEVVEKLNKLVETQFQDKKYLPIEKMIRNISLQLPEIEYEWTTSLVGHLLTEHGYRTIQKFNKDYRYDKIILLRKNSLIKSFDDLIYTILSDYKGNFHEQAVLRYLTDKGIIRENRSANTNSLLSYIRNNPQILRIDDYGSVHLLSREFK